MRATGVAGKSLFGRRARPSYSGPFNEPIQFGELKNILADCYQQRMCFRIESLVVAPGVQFSLARCSHEVRQRERERERASSADASGSVAVRLQEKIGQCETLAKTPLDFQRLPKRLNGQHLQSKQNKEILLLAELK